MHIQESSATTLLSSVNLHLIRYNPLQLLITCGWAFIVW